MYTEAMALYTKGETNKLFPPCVSIVKDTQRRLDLRRNSAAMCRVKVWSVLEKLLMESRPTDKKTTATGPDESTNVKQMKDTKHDLLLILGNNNKHLVTFIKTEVLQNNLYAQSWMASAAELDNADDAAADTDSNKRSSYTSKANALRGTMQQDGTVLRIPKAVLNKWMKRVGHSSK